LVQTLVPCQKDACRTWIDLGGIVATFGRPRQASLVVIRRIGCWVMWLSRCASIVLIGVVEASINRGRSSGRSGRSIRLLLPGGRSGLLAMGEYIWGSDPIAMDSRVIRRGSMHRRGC
jgi:hypothetical protein